MFITLSIVLERMRYEGVVDMFQTVKTLRTQRPAMVQTEVSAPLPRAVGDPWEKGGEPASRDDIPASPLLTLLPSLPCRTSTSCATERHWSISAALTTMQRN